MDSQTAINVGMHWGAVFLYVLATITNVAGIVFRKDKWERGSLWLAGLGMAVHAAVIIYWWRIVGHGPYMAPSEVLSSDAWMVLAAYFVFARFFPVIRPASIVVFPAVFTMVALAIFYNPGIRSLPPTFGTVWLILHILFYKISLGTLVVALALSVLFLLRSVREAAWMQRLPDPAVMDIYAYRFAGFGFVFWGIGVLAGSVWAYYSWGRYWNWDPVETWSLITWILFGIYLHLRRFFGLKGKPAAWFFIGCFVMAIVAYYVTSHMGTSIHSEYFK
ncbi:MAG: cytochrome C biogenesis protein ResC [Verrucomicrobia bacterium]|nr:cytochrome C biogenesis protein ResC [Verrucomicrobiota bacterium]